ncbi:MAG: DUF4397 domain-containing protein [Anaerolineae bacterium]|nr:DUF4397 domain-containing protein [Anaerolineae bacterium]
MRRTSFTTLLLIVILLAASGIPASAQAGDEALAQIRLVHASADAPALAIQIDGIELAAALTFGQATPYFIFAAGEHTVGVDGAPVATFTLEPDQSVTAVLSGGGDALALKTYKDDLTPLEMGSGRLVVIHAASQLDAIDLQTEGGATLVGGVGPGKASPKVDLPAGSYDLFLSATDGDGSALPGSSELNVNSGTLYTIVMLDGGSLTLTSAVRAAEPENAAHLRLAHASPDAPRIDVYLDDVKVFAGVTFGTATELVALPAGSYSVAFYPAGAEPSETVPVTAVALSLSAGEARVLMALGDFSEMTLVAFIENVTPPTPGMARLTVIHAVPDAGPVNFAFADGTVLAQNVEFGGQAPSVELPPARYELLAADPDTGDTLLELSRVQLDAGNTYTVVVVPPSQGTQIVIPLTFSVAAAPVEGGAGAAPAVAQPAGAGAGEEVAQEPTPIPPPAEASPTPTPIPTATPTAVPAAPAVALDIKGKVITDPGYFLNIRAVPGLGQAPMPHPGLPSGAEIEIIGRDTSENWLYMSWTEPGKEPVTGWVAAEYIAVTIDGKPVEFIDEIPLAFGNETPGGAPPPSAGQPDEEETETGDAGAAPGGAQSAFGPGAASFTVTDLHYGEGGRLAQMWVNVANHSMTPALASGNWYPTPNPDGGKQWVTLLKAGFMDGSGVPFPYVGDAPLWEFVVTTNDGLVFSAYAGCEYYNEVVTLGFEPTAEGGFTWEQVLEGGWFSCGGDWGAGNIKPDHDLLPGETASVPLNIWVTSPHTAPEVAPERRIIRLDFIPRTPDGQTYGVLYSVSLSE